MLDLEELGKRSIYRRHLDLALVSVVPRDTLCPVFRLLENGVSSCSTTFKWGKGTNSPITGWWARIEDRGFTYSPRDNCFAKFSEKLSRSILLPGHNRAHVAPTDTGDIPP